MKIWIVWLIGCLFVLPGVAEEKVDSNLRVLCYNIHWAKGMDGKYDIERIANVINAQKPDLVALQEVDVGVRRSGQVHEVRELARLTGMHARFGPTQHYDGGLFGNAILSKYPIESVEIHPLPYSDSDEKRTTYPRGCIVTTIKSPGGELLRFVSTHFQHNVPEDRVAEAKAINQLLTSSDIPTILAGDMNALPDSEPIRILLEKWADASAKSPAPTVPVKNPKSRIDYIFFRPADRFVVNDAKVINEQVASDHLPVLVELKIVSTGNTEN